MTIFREVPADSRITLDLNSNRYLRDRNLSISVRSVDGLPLLAERPMYFRYHGWMDGGSDAFGQEEGHTSWYFPEGFTSDTHPFREYICIGNFGDYPARGTMTLLGAGGEGLEMEIEVDPGFRQTQYINSYIQGEVAVKLETDRPVVAERSVYFRYNALENGFTADGGHTKAGLNSLSRNWYFAEGHVGDGFEEWVSLANPNGEKASVTVTYYTPAGKWGEKGLSLAPETRNTLFVNEDFGVPGDVSVQVESELPIACERAMYFNYNGSWDDGHASPGVLESSTTWLFAEGSAYSGIDEYVLLVNTGRETARVETRYLMGPGEGTYGAVYRIGPGQRVTVNVNRELSGFGLPSQVALEVDSDLPIVAERAMYFDMGRGDSGGEPIRGGHVSLGVQKASPQWYFAEAYTGK
ncbi:MAG: hypothetical protein SWK76_01085 [Actinomycetota bacterium]|nr:hypothetical protein [Actinomycetota bacterium]